ncbi:unnamed protein product [Mucor hiemalis]
MLMYILTRINTWYLGVLQSVQSHPVVNLSFNFCLSSFFFPYSPLPFLNNIHPIRTTDMSFPDQKDANNSERDISVNRVFKEKVEEYDSEDMQCILLTVSYHSIQENNNIKSKPRYQYMLWELASISKFDFFTELQKKLKLEDVSDYEITTSNACLVDQEDFYGAIIGYLRDNGREDELMHIDIRKKSYSR